MRKSFLLLSILFTVLILLGACKQRDIEDTSSGSGGNSSLWTFVDWNSVIGINKDPSQDGLTPQMTVSADSRLYATWEESGQIRVAQYNGNDSTPGWSFVDGNAATGINWDSTKNAQNPQLTAWGSMLYSTWEEDNGTASQIHVRAYDNSSWTFVDWNTVNGLNWDPAKNAGNPQLTAWGSMLYSTWEEDNGTASQIHVRAYDNSSWTFVDWNTVNGINLDPSKDALNPQLTALGSKLYATWSESAGSTSQIRVASFNGNISSPSWSFVGGNSSQCINKDCSKDARFPQLTIFNLKLYAIWQELYGAIWQIRVAVYDGNDSSPSWSFVDGGSTNGINKDITKQAFTPQLTVFGSQLYATWYEDKGGSVYQIRVAAYNGNDAGPSWSFVDGNGTDGINWDVSEPAINPQLTAFGPKLYAIWEESNGTKSQIHTAVKK